MIHITSEIRLNKEWKSNWLLKVKTTAHTTIKRTTGLNVNTIFIHDKQVTYQVIDKTIMNISRQLLFHNLETVFLMEITWINHQVKSRKGFTSPLLGGEGTLRSLLFHQALQLYPSTQNKI